MCLQFGLPRVGPGSFANEFFHSPHKINNLKKNKDIFLTLHLVFNSLTQEPSTLFAANIFAANIFAANIFAANIFAANIFTANIFTTNIFAANIFAANIFAANIFAANIFAANIFTANIFAANIFAANIFAANIFAGNIFEIFHGALQRISREIQLLAKQKHVTLDFPLCFM